MGSLFPRPRTPRSPAPDTLQLQGGRQRLLLIRSQTLQHTGAARNGDA